MSQADALKLASLLLQHPTGELWGAREELREAWDELPPGRQRDRIGRFLDWASATPLVEAQRAYVETFDFTRRSALHLTYHRWGDLRQRGLALLRIKQAYAAAGFELTDSELPDYLPVMLEFAALAGDPGLDLLAGQREALELVRSSLQRDGSPYVALLDAVTAVLPRLTSAQAARAARLAAEGPPTEEVGLEPFAPPEVMPT